MNIKKNKIFILFFVLGLAQSLSADSSINLLREKAAGGDANAQLELGIYYRDSCDGNNISETKKWLSKSAENGNTIAQRMLGIFLMETTNDQKAGFNWILKAAKGGDSDSQTIVGLYYGAGGPVNINDKESVKWLTLAADKGDLKAQTALGMNYVTGNGVEKNDRKGLEFFSRAAEGGYTRAQFVLSLLYAQGGTFEVDLVKAYKWMYLAAKGGEAEANFYLPTLASKLTRSEISEAKAKAGKWEAEFSEKNKNNTPKKLQPDSERLCPTSHRE